MPTVAELDILIDATDRATDDLARIGALVDSMSDKDFDIVVKAMVADALRDLGKVNAAAAKATDDVVIDLEFNEANFRATMAEIDKQLDQLDGRQIQIDAEADTLAAMQQLAAVNAAMAHLDGLTAEVEVNADTDKAQAAVLGFTDHMKKLGTHSVVASRNVRGLIAAAVALAPALAPIGVVGVGGLVSFAAAATSAGLGVGLFAVVAKTAYGKVQEAVSAVEKAQLALTKAVTEKEKEKAIAKLAEAYRGLSPLQVAAAKAQLAFNAEWDKFVARYEPAIFQMIAAGFQGITDQLPRLTPMLDGVTQALWRLEQRAITALASPFWQSFFDYLGRTAGPMLEGFGLSLGNLAKAFAGLMIAFEPLTTAFVNGMVKMTEKFAQWATTLQTNQGFQQFVDYVVANTPVVLDIIGQLWKLFVNLIEALMPIGERALPVIRDFLDTINKFADAHPHIATMVVGFIALVAVVIALSGPVAAVWAAMKLLAAPIAYLAMTGIPALIAAFGGVAVAAGGFGAAVLLLGLPLVALGISIYTVITHFDDFVASLQSIVGWLGNAYAALEQFHTGISTKLRSALGMAAPEMKNAGKNWMQKLGEGGAEGTPAAVAPFQALQPQVAASVSMLAPYMSQVGNAGMVGLGGSAAAASPVALAPFADLQPQINAMIATLPPSMQAEATESMAAFGLGAANGVPVGAAPFGQLPPEVLAMVGDTSNLLNPQGNQAATSFGNGYSIAMLGVMASVAAGMQGVNRIVVAELAVMANSGRVGVANFAGALMSGMGAALQAGSQLANAAVQGASTANYRMAAAGSSAGSSFAAGIRSQAGAVASASRALANAAARSMPGSPAKEGPLSGQGYALLRGQRFGEDLARGISARVAAVTAATNQIAGAMAMADARTSAATYAATRSRGGVLQTGDSALNGNGTAFNFTINNPIAEPTSVTTNKALQRVATLKLA